MKTSVIPITPTTIRIQIYITSQNNGTAALTDTSLSYIDLPTSNIAFEQLLLFQATVDFNGVISVLDMFVDMFSDNSANAVSKLQVSGNGGTTWIDVTDEIPTGLDVERAGSGIWIPSINTGSNKFRIRLVGKTTGGAATVRISQDSYMIVIINKKVI